MFDNEFEVMIKLTEHKIEMVRNTHVKVYYIYDKKYNQKYIIDVIPQISRFYVYDDEGEQIKECSSIKDLQSFLLEVL